MDPEEIKKKYEAARKAATDICEAAKAAGRDLTPDEIQKVENAVTEAKSWREKYREVKGQAALRSAVEELGASLGSDTDADTKGLVQTAVRSVKSFGDLFVAAEEFRAWERRAPQKGFQSPPIALPGLLKSLGLPHGLKDIITGGSDTSAGAFTQIDYQNIYEVLGRRQRSILARISRRTTGSDLVEYVRQTSRTNNAAPVPEASGSSAGDQNGDVVGEKPESDIALVKVTAPVRTIANVAVATRRALADAGQMRGIIDEELKENLEDELEDQIVNGTGTGEDFTGLENTPGTLSQAFHTDVFVTTRRAKTFLQMVGRDMPTAYWMNPEDWQDIELDRDNEDRFRGNGPFGTTEPRLWGVPVIETEVVPQGKAWLLNEKKLVLWDREEANVVATDSHKDFFSRNLVAIRAELRAAFGVTRPSSVVEIDLQTGS